MFALNKDISLKMVSSLKHNALNNPKAKLKLLEQLKTELQLKHFSRKNKNILGWKIRFLDLKIIDM